MSDLVDDMPVNVGGRPTLSSDGRPAVKVTAWVPPDTRDEFESLVTRWAQCSGITPADARRSILAHGMRAVREVIERIEEYVTGG